MSKKVLQLIKTYKSNAPLLNSMAKSPSGEFTTVACYLSGTDDGKNGMHAVAEKVIYSQIRKSKLYWTSWSTLKHVAKIIDDNDIDLVVCQFRRPIPIGALSALISKRKPKVVGILHGIVGGDNGIARKLANWIIYSFVSRLISVSNEGTKDIIRSNIGLTSDKVVPVPNGIQCERFLTDPQIPPETLFPNFYQGDFTFLMVGRLAPKKSHVVVLHAFAELLKFHENAKLLIAGTGPVEQQLRSLIDELGLLDNVSLLGFRDDVPALLHACDVFLMPSLREGLPLALMEAMVTGTPVITSDVIGMRELVPDESFGYLADPTSISSVVIAMKQSITDAADTRVARGEKAKQRILEKHTEKVMLENYESLYKEALSEK
ncbi:MAG: glycosyltransferase family 4 protein [Cellvibrionaceae bacterium]